MPQQGKRHADSQLLLALACGASVEVAARQAGISESTAYRRFSDPAFRRQLQAVRADLVQRTTGALTAASTEAVRALLELLKATAPPPVRLGAARSVLELGIKLRETVDLEARIAALEEQLALSQAG
jgi:hypothetical protein